MNSLAAAGCFASRVIAADTRTVICGSALT